MAERVAKFRLKNYRITKSNFEIKQNRGSSEDSNSNLAIEVKRENLYNESKSLFKLVMSVDIKDNNGNINISAKTEGIFEFDSDLNEQQKSSFFDVNAPAILFPYIRAYISALTSLSGFNPIVIPTINFAASAENKTIDKK